MYNYDNSKLRYESSNSIKVLEDKPSTIKYHTQLNGDYSSYAKNDYTFLHNNGKLTNMSSLIPWTPAELEKKKAEAQIAREDFQRHREEKIKKLAAKQQEKKELLNELVAYNPWGKPGAGAPKTNSTRIADIESSINMSGRVSPSPFGKPGAGAPLKTNSGKLKATINVDPEIRFQKRERGQVIGVVGPDPKYGIKNPVVTDLDILAKKTREERNVAKREIYYPFGKPGAGAPLQDDNGKIKTTRCVNVARSIKEPYIDYDPFGKSGAGAPNRDSNGNIAVSRTLNLSKTVQEYDPKNENYKFQNQPKWYAYLKQQHLKSDGDRYMDKEKQRRYNEELEEINRINNVMREKEILQERKDSLLHAATCGNFWGKPGNGAPLNENRRRKVDMLV